MSAQETTGSTVDIHQVDVWDSYQTVSALCDEVGCTFEQLCALVQLFVSGPYSHRQLKGLRSGKLMVHDVVEALEAEVAIKEYLR